DGAAAPFVAVLGTHPPVCELGALGKLCHFARWFPHWLWRSGLDWKARRERERWVEVAHGSRPAGPEQARHSIVSGNMDLALRYRPVPDCPLVLDLFRERNAYCRHGHPLK